MQINIKEFLQKYGLIGVCFVCILLFADVVLLNIRLDKLTTRIGVAENVIAKFAKGELPLIQVGEKGYPILPLIWQGLQKLKLGEASQSEDKFQLP